MKLFKINLIKHHGLRYTQRISKQSEPTHFFDIIIRYIRHKPCHLSKIIILIDHVDIENHPYNKLFKITPVLMIKFLILLVFCFLESENFMANEKDKRKYINPFLEIQLKVLTFQSSTHRPSYSSIYMRLPTMNALFRSERSITALNYLSFVFVVISTLSALCFK